MEYRIQRTWEDDSNKQPFCNYFISAPAGAHEHALRRDTLGYITCGVAGSCGHGGHLHSRVVLLSTIAPCDVQVRLNVYQEFLKNGALNLDITRQDLAPAQNIMRLAQPD